MEYASLTEVLVQDTSDFRHSLVEVTSLQDFVKTLSVMKPKFRQSFLPLFIYQKADCLAVALCRTLGTRENMQINIACLFCPQL